MLKWLFLIQYKRMSRADGGASTHSVAKLRFSSEMPKFSLSLFPKVP